MKSVRHVPPGKLNDPFVCLKYPGAVPEVLVVDDDPRVADVLLEFLSEEGFDVCYEEDGQRALDHIANNPPDVVLADMVMPQLNGVMLLHEIHDRWKNIDVILMSATESPVGLPVPFLQKPFDLNQVIWTICNYDRLH